LPAMLIEARKEQQQQIDQMEQRLEGLDASVD
jgi:hypothetical protein